MRPFSAEGHNAGNASEANLAAWVRRLQEQYILHEINPGPVRKIRFPRIMTTDHSASLFFSAFDTKLQSPCLHRFDLDTMRTHALISDRLYSGLWFDRGSDVLFATRFLKNGERNHAIEILDRNGKIQGVRPLPDTGIHQVLYPTILSGDDKSRLYLMDEGKSQLLSIKRNSLELSSIIRFPQLRHFTSFKVIKNRLFFVFKTLHAIGILEAPTGGMEWITTDNLRFPAYLAADPTEEYFFVVRTGHSFHSSTENDRHAIIKADKTFQSIFQGWLKPCRVSDAIALRHEERTALFLADLANGLRWFWLTPEIGKNQTQREVTGMNTS